ncbi:MAG: hypothetical protein IPK60_11425 [Sandaracinaceae bacterium]|jgi:hypothetical protein|nr:hypothetical protein [Sandaracinaceae bacterium]
MTRDPCDKRLVYVVDDSIAFVPVVVISADGSMNEKPLPFTGERLRKPMRLDHLLGVIEKHC